MNHSVEIVVPGRQEITKERPVSGLDSWLARDEVFFDGVAENVARRELELGLAVAYQLANNPAYSDYCSRQGFQFSDIAKAGLGAIPVLPSGVFKRNPGLVRTGNTNVVQTTSSGTQGSISRIPRDDVTMMRFFASISASVRDLLRVEHAETMVHNVGPHVGESEHLWISYVMSGVAVIHQCDFYISQEVLQYNRLYAALQNGVSSVPEIIVGPPPVLLDVARAVLNDGPLDRSSQRFIITIGGWKRRVGEMLPRPEFNSLMGKAFGLNEESQVRDAFNMVELNSLVLECAYHQKHCPPWLFAAARDPKTMRLLDSGESGILSYADPTPVSFPGMVLSEDFGQVLREVECPCGVTGDILRIDRRINRLESRGCALKMS